jgi:pimeloyl-ACP methyl ester carboxylesterase
MTPAIRRSQRTLEDSGQPFESLFLAPANPRAVVLFAVGAGGDPARHLPLLQSLAERGCIVTAPHFSRLTSPVATAPEMDLRARRLKLALDVIARTSLPIAGVGHSIGAALLLVLAGAEARTRHGDAVRVLETIPFEKLGLMAPATQFFGAPGALGNLRAEISVWAGARDEITPPSQTRFLEQALQGQTTVQAHIEAEAGHFSFMHAPPPHVAEPHPDRERFLRRLVEQLGAFIVA